MSTHTILVLDDQELILALMKRQLQREHHHVLGASTIKEARELFAANRTSIDVLIADFNLPDGRGDEFAYEAYQSKPQLHVIYTSGSVDERVPQEVPNATYFYKPFQFEELTQTIRSFKD